MYIKRSKDVVSTSLLPDIESIADLDPPYCYCASLPTDLPLSIVKMDMLFLK